MKAIIKNIKFSAKRQIVVLECDEDKDFVFFLQDVRQKEALFGWMKRQKAMKPHLEEGLTLIQALGYLVKTQTEIPMTYLYPIKLRV